jgi:hypothetical protein
MRLALIEERCVTGRDTEQAVIVGSIWGVTQPQNSKNFDILVVV